MLANARSKALWMTSVSDVLQQHQHQQQQQLLAGAG
jgi:hypothetical protein